MNYILKPAAALFITAVITVTLLSVVYNLTLVPIERQKQKTQEAAMSAVLPQAAGYRKIPADISGSIVAVYEGEKNGNTAGYVIQLAREGYSGKIDLIVGISAPDKKITGIRVLRHSETPGLGSLSVKENFYRQYDNKALSPLTVVRGVAPGEQEIAAITSATITSRAITNAVNEAIAWYNGRSKQ